MTALEEIKKALEGVTHAPGKWEAEGTAVYCDDATGQRVCDTKGEYLFWSEDQKRNAAVYIAAVNPAAISELLSTLESLQRENEELRKALLPFAELPDNAHGTHRYFLELLVCPDGDTPADGVKHYGESIRTARQALASTGGEHNAE